MTLVRLDNHPYLFGLTDLRNQMESDSTFSTGTENCLPTEVPSPSQLTITVPANANSIALARIANTCASVSIPGANILSVIYDHRLSSVIPSY